MGCIRQISYDKEVKAFSPVLPSARFKSFDFEDPFFVNVTSLGQKLEVSILNFYVSLENFSGELFSIT